MRSIRRFFTRLSVAMTRRKMDDRFIEEYEDHIAGLTEENIRSGMSPEQARRAAILKFGPMESLKEDYRDQQSLPFFETLIQDLRFTFRTLRRDTGFALIVIAILGIGIGANTTIYSIINPLILQSLPLKDSDRLVWIENDRTQKKGTELSGSKSLSEVTSRVDVLESWRRLNTSFEELEGYFAFFGYRSFRMSGGGEPEKLVGVNVTQGFFPMLGVQPILGRNFIEDEYKPNSLSAVLISYGLWQRQFAADPGIVGRSIKLNDLSVTVVGVMPKGFDFGSIFVPGTQADLFVPLPLDDIRQSGNTLAIIGKLKPGVNVEQARHEFEALNEQLFREIPSQRGSFGSRLAPLQDYVSGSIKSSLILLTGAVGLVLLIVCVNVGNLLLARTASRQQEIAIRLALGAKRGRIIRQMLTESLLLSTAGGVTGILLSSFATNFLSHLTGTALPLLDRVHVDPHALLFTVGITMLTGVLLGLAPVFEIAKNDIQSGLKDSSRSSSEGHQKTWLRSALVVSEVALACLLIVGTGLLVRSFMRVLDIDLGFQPERTAALRIIPGEQIRNHESLMAFLQELQSRIRQVPGVEAVSGTDALPLDRNRSWGISAKGAIYPEGIPSAHVSFVFPDYFRAMGIPVRSGREFTEADHAKSRSVVILNQTGARALYPNIENAIGQILLVGDRECEVTGVVSDVRHSGPEIDSGIEMYLPVMQGEGQAGSASIDFVIRTTLEPESLASGVRSAVRPLDPNLPITEFLPLQNLVDRATSPRRIIVWMLVGFAGIALLLAALGIYGVISYSVSKRTQEIGIRMALGASARNVQMGVIQQTLQLVMAGIAIGIAAALALSHLVTSMLFGVSTHDPLTYIVAPLLLTLTALFAAFLPARRASRIDPMTALRST